MDWLVDTLLEPSSIQAIIAISLISALGLQLGKIKVFNISLGITFVFFVGILVGHFRIEMNKDVLVFAQNFGLVIFVYVLGLQVGPGFFSSFKKDGITLNMLAMAVIFIGFIITILISYTTDISLPNLIGILCGAVTNTPVLGAAQQALKQVSYGDANTLSQMALGCAIAYPMGVIGVILAIAFMRSILIPHKLKEKKPEKGSSDTYVGEYHVTNPALSGKTIAELMKHSSTQFVISRLWRKGKVSIPVSDTVIHFDDHLLIISSKGDVEKIKLIFGEKENVDWNKEDIDWNHIDKSHLVSRQIIVTRSKVNGAKLGTLKLRNLYGINITRINRSGIDLFPSPNLTLLIGDKLTVVGESASINNVAKILGDEIKRLNDPNLIAIFLGVAIGLVFGALPWPIPGMSIPIKLGIAGGPIIIGILMGAFGPRFRITTYTTESASLMMRQFGIVVYLACLGLSAGENFFETIFRPEGLMWIFIGIVLTIVPVILVGIIAMKLYKINYSKSVGMLCGSMANPMALNYVNSTVEGDEPSVAYATVYPVSMFVRIVATQLLLLVFL